MSRTPRNPSSKTTDIPLSELRAVFYSIGDGVITCDRQGKVTLLNPVAEMLTGWSEAEALGKPLGEVFRIINEETRQPAENPLQRVLREGIVAGLANHTLLIRRNGDEIPVADSGAPIRTEDGHISGAVLVFRDQSAERAAQRQIAEARRFAEGIVETVREPLMVLDGDLRVVRTNPAFYRLFQTTREDTENRLLYELGNGQWNIPELRRLLEEILPLNTRFNDFEVRHNFPNIGRRIMLLNARRIYHEDNKTRYILLAIEDVTERQQAVDSLNHSEERYRAIAGLLADYAYTFEVLEDGSLRREWITGDFERITSFTPEESQARGGWQALIYPPDTPIALRRAERLMKGLQDTSEFRIVRKDGAVRWLRDHGLPVWDEHQKRVVRIFGAAQDITDQKKRQLEIEAQSRLVHILQQEGELQPLLEHLLEAACHAIPAAEKGSILLVDDGGTLHMRATIGYQDERVMTASFPIQSGYSAKAFRENRPLVIEDARGQDETRYDGEILEMATVQSAIVAPLLAGGRPIGVLVLDNCTYKNAFTDQDLQVLTSFAVTAGLLIERTRLFEETRQRLQELELIARLSAELRKAATRSELLPVLLEQLMTQMKVDGAILETVNPVSGDVTIEWGVGIWESLIGEVIPAGEGLSAVILQSGATYLNNDACHDPRVYFPQQLGECNSIAGVPLRADDTINGLLWVGSFLRLNEDDLRLLRSVADMAASALLRMQLHEETRLRVEQLQALQAIDRVITTSLDLRFSLDALLEQTLLHLKMDAAGVLLYNPNTLMLEYAAGRGFRTRYYQKVRLHLGESQAGLAALERRIIHCGDLNAAEPPFLHLRWIEEEGFVSYCGVPLIAKGQVKGVLEVFSRSPFDPQEEWLDFLEALSRQAAIAIENAQLFENLQRTHLDLSLAYEATIEGWSRALDLRDKETEGHTQRVIELTLLMAKQMGLSSEQMAHLRRGALLHDIGKMGIPDAILLKPGALTDEEWEIMRKHPLYAYEMLYPIQYLRPALDIPYCHHEKWDGGGYPRRLKGEEIPLAARIFAVADVWDALISDRPYRSAWTKVRALDYIREQAGKHFDPQVIKVFFEVIEEFLAEEAASENPFIE